MKQKQIATAFIILTILVSAGALISTAAAGDPSERFKGYNLEQLKWTTGNLGKDYYEGDYVSYLLRLDSSSKVWGTDSFDIAFNFYQESSDAVYISGFDTSEETGFQYRFGGGWLLNTEMLPDYTLWTHIPTLNASQGTGDVTILNLMEPIDPADTQELPSRFRYFTVNISDPETFWAQGDWIFFFFRARLSLDIIWSNGLEANLPDTLDGGQFDTWDATHHGSSFATGSSRHFILEYPGIGDKTIPIPIAQYPPTLLYGYKYVDGAEYDGWNVSIASDLGLGGPYVYYDWALTGDGMFVNGSAWPTGYYEFPGLVQAWYNLTEEDERDGIIYDYVEVDTNGTKLPAPSVDVYVLRGGSNRTDFYNIRPSSISGYKWNDTNGDGVWDGGEQPLNDWMIHLKNSTGHVIGTASTGDVGEGWPDGYYEFTMLKADTYTVNETVKKGWIQTYPSGLGTHVIPLGAGENNTDNNFGNFKLGIKRGYKLNDLTGNGWSSDDTPLENWTIQLWNDTDGSLLNETATNANGYYYFANLRPGTYKVNETLPEGWICTSPNPCEHVFTVTSGFSETNNNFTNFKLGTKAGYKFEDMTGDGESPDDWAHPLSGWTILLNKSDGAGGWVPSGSCETNSSGRYEFTGLGPGIYRVYEDLEEGWIQTSPVCHIYHEFNVTSGFEDLNNNFTNFELGTKGGYKFEDPTGDGETPDDWDHPLSGWEIQLFKWNSTHWEYQKSDITNGSGYYNFTDLEPGEYRVAEMLQEDWVQTSPLCPEYHEFNVTSGFEDLNNNFTNFEEVSISGYKWNDKNGNATWDEGEPALQAWIIKLYKWNGTAWEHQASTFTNGSGYYEFTGLGPGTYNVTEVEEPLWVQSYPELDGDHIIPVTSGQNETGNNFGNFYPKIQLTVCTTYDSDREEVTFEVTVTNPLPPAPGFDITNLTDVLVASYFPDNSSNPLDVINPLIGPVNLTAGSSYQYPGMIVHTFDSGDEDPFAVRFLAAGYTADGDLVTTEIIVSVDW